MMRGKFRSYGFAACILAVMIALLIHGGARSASLVVPDDFPTIQAAIDAAASGDTIIVRPGTYSENLTLDKSVILTAEVYYPGHPTDNPTIIDGPSGDAAIFVPGGVSPMPTVRGFVIRDGDDGIRTESELVIEYNFFDSASGDSLDYGPDSGGIYRHNVCFDPGDDCIDLDFMNHSLLIENNRLLYSLDDGIEARLQDDYLPPEPITITIRGNLIIGAYEDGIQLIDYSQPLDTNRRFVITGNLIAGSHYAGIGLMPNGDTSENYSGADIVESIRVYNNTLYDNNYGISGGDNLVAFNNIIASSPTRGVWRVQGISGSNSVVAYALFYGNNIDAEQSQLGAGNLFGQDPLFASPPNPGPDGVWGTMDDDFSGLVLQPGSPAIDAGVTQYIAISGEAIPPVPITNYSGAAPDLGWAEYTALLKVSLPLVVK